MPTRSADATWEGNLQEGEGAMNLESGAYQGQYSYQSRFEEGTGTNPEELIGAAHAGCFSMALSNMLDEDGYTPERVHTTSNVTLEMVDDSPTITKILLETEATVPGLDDRTFQEIAQKAKENCPVSKVLAGADISLDATLNG